MARMKGGRGTMTEAECRAEIRKFFMELYPACTVIYAYPGNAARPPAPYVVLDFDAADSSQIDEYVDDGILQQTWYICLKPRELEIEAIITNSPVTWAEQHAASSSRVETMVEELRQLWLKKTPVLFTAAGDSYENMCITSITAPRTVEDGSSTRLTIKLKQASINSTDMANISVKYIRGGTSKKNTGAGQKSSSSTSGTQKDEKATKSSILCSGAKAIGLFK